MVTQDPSPGAGTEGVEMQERRSQTAAAIRRGDIKISEPMPWQEGAEPSVAASPAQHRTQHSGGSSNSQTSNKGAVEEQPVVSDRGQVQIHDVLPEEDEEQQLESPPSDAPHSPPLRHKRASLSMREDLEAQKQNQPPQNRHTTPVDQMLNRESMAPMTDSLMSSGKGSVQKRGKRSSGIKSVFKRLFSRREKQSPKGERRSPRQTTPPSKHGYHTSDPLPATMEDPSKQSAQPRRNTSPRDTRQPVLPSEDYTPSRPPQRLPFPMNINAPAEASPPHHYTSFETSPHVHRRRATLPSIVVSASDQAALKAYWGSSEPQLSSPSDHGFTGRTPSPLIGMAISTGINQKRRSRSAGALYEMAKLDEQAELRRRSADIQSWRPSFRADTDIDPSAGPSSECRSIEGDSMISRPEESVADASISDAMADAGSSIRNEHIRHFDFGGLRDRDPQAAAQQAQVRESELPLQVPSALQSREKTQFAPVDQRLSLLESSVLGLKHSLHELTDRAQRQTVLLGQVPEAKRARSYSPTRPSDTQQSTSIDRHNKPSFGLPTNPKDSFHQGYAPKRIQPSPPSSSSTISTMKPSMRRIPESYLSSPSSSGGAVLPHQNFSPDSMNLTPTPQSAQRLSRSASAAAMGAANTVYPDPNTQDQTLYTHLAPLYSALRYERLQRKVLETKVEQITKQMHDLTTVLSQMRTSVSHAATMYPTPSPEDRMYATTDHNRPATAPDRDTIIIPDTRQTSRFSASAYGESDADAVSESNPDADSIYADSHEREERDARRHVHVHDTRDLDPILIGKRGDVDDDEYASPLEKWSTPGEEKSGWVHAGNLPEEDALLSPRSIEGEMF